MIQLWLFPARSWMLKAVLNSNREGESLLAGLWFLRGLAFFLASFFFCCVFIFILFIFLSLPFSLVHFCREM